MSAEGWVCPTCKRGIAPTEKTCDHGGYLRLVGLPLSDIHPESGCFCPPGTACSNVMCPKLNRFTCQVSPLALAQ